MARTARRHIWANLSNPVVLLTFMNVLRIIMRSILFRIAIFAILGLFGYSRVSDSKVDETTRDSAGEVTQAGVVGSLVLQFRDCLVFPNDSFKTEAYSEFSQLKVVPCTELHDGQIGGVHVLPDGSYPGANYFSDEYFRKTCSDDYDAFTKTYLDDPPHLFIPFYPTENSWLEGDREVQCVFTMADGGKLGASIEG